MVGFPVVVEDHFLVFVVGESHLSLVSLFHQSVDVDTSTTCSHVQPWLKGWSKQEWSVDVEIRVLTDSLSRHCLGILQVDNLPLLVDTIVFVVSNNFLVLFIFAFKDIKYLSLGVDNMLSFISEDGPPSTVGTSSSDELTFTIWFNLNVVASPLTYDSSGLVIEEEDLLGTSGWGYW
jgi:hypothetical protein